MNKQDSISIGILNKFCLQDVNEINTDSSILIFYCSKYLDTSSLIRFKQEDKLIRVNYYNVLPNYHKYLDDYSDFENQLLFFEGYSFIVNSAVWNEVKAEANILIKDTLNAMDKEAYLDGASFALYYDGKAIYGNASNSTKFELFDTQIKELFLNNIIHQRKPRIFKKANF